MTVEKINDKVVIKNNIEPLYYGNKKCDALIDAILEVIYERGSGMEFPMVLGILDLAKQQLIEDMKKND